MKDKTFILNGKSFNMTPEIIKTEGMVEMTVYGSEEMKRAFRMLADNAMLSRSDISKARRIMKMHARPLVSKMKSLAPVSSRTSGVLERKTKPGNLRRAIGTKDSKRFKTLPVIYVGARRGRKEKNDGWYAFLAEFGRKGIRAEGKRPLMFASKSGGVVKKYEVAGFEGRYFFKKAMDSEGEKVINKTMNTFMNFYGDIWERAGIKPQIKE